MMKDVNMGRMHRVWMALGVLATAPVAPACADAQDPGNLRFQVVQLLNESPLLNPTLSVVQQAIFVRDARVLLDGGLEIESALDATRALEETLEGTVTATVESVPAGLVVTYNPITDPEAQELAATTRDEFPLRPALYEFRCTNPETGVEEVQRKSCATNCRVMFNFER